MIDAMAAGHLDTLRDAAKGMKSSPEALLAAARWVAGLLTPSDRLAALSPREREVFDLAVAGVSNRDMATRLRISIKTVEAHRAGINRKLGTHNTADLVRYAARAGLSLGDGSGASEARS